MRLLLCSRDRLRYLNNTVSNAFGIPIIATLAAKLGANTALIGDSASEAGHPSNNSLLKTDCTVDIDSDSHHNNGEDAVNASNALDETSEQPESIICS